MKNEDKEKIKENLKDHLKDLDELVLENSNKHKSKKQREWERLRRNVLRTIPNNQPVQKKPRRIPFGNNKNKRK